jgi:hypothetical protein
VQTGGSSRRRPVHQHRRGDRGGWSIVWLAVRQQPAAQSSLRALLWRIRGGLGRRHGRRVERQPARHALAEDGYAVRDVSRQRWRRPTGRGAIPGGHHCGARVRAARRSLGQTDPGPRQRTQETALHSGSGARTEPLAPAGPGRNQRRRARTQGVVSRILRKFDPEALPPSGQDGLSGRSAASIGKHRGKGREG